MSGTFSPIVTEDGRTYTHTSGGIYDLSTRPFGTGNDQFRIKGATFSPKSGLHSAVIAYKYHPVEIYQQAIDQGLAPALMPKPALVQLVIQSPAGVTSTDIDQYIADLSYVASPERIDLIMKGAS